MFPGAILSLCLSASGAINSASQEILRMVNQGVSQDVIQNYISGTSASYSLNADDILYLQQNGVPQPVISSMITHDNSIAQSTTQPYSSQQSPSYSQDQSQSYQTSTSDYQTTQQVNPPDAYATQNYGQDQQVVQVAPQQAPPQVASFYDDLRPYGNWIYLEGSGWCWQPYEVRTVSNWQPYCDNGTWVYSEDGWYWQSYYNWGWAPFHYVAGHMQTAAGFGIQIRCGHRAGLFGAMLTIIADGRRCRLRVSTVTDGLGFTLV